MRPGLRASLRNQMPQAAGRRTGVNLLPKAVCRGFRYELLPSLPSQIEEPKDAKVAIIGAGPAGLTAAYYLAAKDTKSRVFEALPVAGGMLAVGIPEYRLPKDILNAEVKAITDLGVEIKYNTAIGKDITIEKLLTDGYGAVLMATGAHKGQKLGIPGDDAEGVIDGATFLRNFNLKKAVKVEGQVAVIGGGNVAIDAARSALRLGAKDVSILYRREKEDMPAYEERYWRPRTRASRYTPSWRRKDW